MKPSIRPVITAFALTFIASASPKLSAQTTTTHPETLRKDTLFTSTHQPETPGNDALSVPKITVKSGQQATIEIQGLTILVTPTTRPDNRVELLASVGGLAGNASLVSLDAVAATDIKVLMARIERTIFLRAFEKVVDDICQAQLDPIDEPFLGEEATEHVKRVEQHNARMAQLNELRERLRRQLEQTDETSARK